jgi:hypothetical protein
MMVSFLSGSSRAFPNRIGQAFAVQMRRIESEVPEREMSFEMKKLLRNQAAL